MPLTTTKNSQTLSIKNMVCPRCIMVVQNKLEDLGFQVIDIELGRARVKSDTPIPIEKIDKKLKKYGFELVRGKNQQLVEQIKASLIQYVQGLETEDNPENLSDYLSKKLHRDYSSLSSTFSKSEDITIEKYLIHLKIERVKEWLSYGELTLSEIAYKLNYSSVAYLSNQFKKITGLSVTDYKKQEILSASRWMELGDGKLQMSNVFFILPPLFLRENPLDKCLS